MTETQMRGLQAGHYKSTALVRFIAHRRPQNFLRLSPTAILLQQVIVPDVSFWQDAPQTAHGIDFNKMVLAGAQGVIIRAGQGSWIDQDFVTNWNNAKTAGLPRGAYWFYDPRVDPHEQAERFAALFGSDPQELDLWLDAEYPSTWGGAYAGWQHLYDFLERLSLRLPSAQITIYTGYYWWFENVVRHTSPAQLAYFERYPLNIAWYTDDPAIVRIPPPWTVARWWQFTSSASGPYYGAESEEIDLNYFNGTPEEYRETFNLGGDPEPPPAGEIMKGTVLVTANIRDGSPANAIVGKVYRGDVMYGEVRPYLGLQRLFYTKVYRAEGNVQVWAEGSNTAVNDGDTQILRLDNVPEPTPPPSGSDLSIDIQFDSAGVATSVIVDGVAWVKP